MMADLVVVRPQAVEPRASRRVRDLLAQLVQDEARLRRVVAQLLPQLADEDPQVVGVPLVRLAPDGAQQLLVRDDAPGMHRQVAQQLELLARQVHRLAGDADGVARLVDHQLAHLDHRRRRVGCRPGAQQGAHAGQQLGHAEGLGHVVVGPGVQRRHLLRLGLAHREHQHRHRRPLAQRPHHGLAVAIRQPEVEHHQLRPLGGGQRQAGGAVGGLQHGIAVGLQRDAQEAADLRLVVDHQDACQHIAHGVILLPAAHPAAGR